MNNRFGCRSFPGMLILLCTCLGVVFSSVSCLATDAHQWSDNEKAVLKSLWIGTLPPLPVDPGNRFSDNPRAAALGKKLFFDTRFSGNRQVSCATCHRQDYAFTDNLPLSHGMETTPRRSMPLVGVVYNAWFFWDGRKDSLWSQALGPIESQLEHGFSRTMTAYVIGRDYRDEFTELFGPMPDISPETWPQNARPATDDPEALKAWIFMTASQRETVNNIYANMGKAIAAFVRTIVPGTAPFDRYVEALTAGDGEILRKELTDKEASGLRLFIGKAKCINCHNGPMFTNSDFHNLGLPGQELDKADQGRADGITQVLADEFNCLSSYSDANPADCLELRFLDTSEQTAAGAFKTPTLRNVAERPPYMHAGQFSTLRQVLEFYRRSKSPELGHGGLSDQELDALESFLKTLSGPISSL